MLNHYNNELVNKDIRSLFDLYMDECRYIKQLRDATLSSYKEVFNNFRNRSPEIQKVRDLTPTLVMRFFYQLGKKESRTSTIRTYYDKLMAFFRWLENYNHIEKGSLVRHILKPPNPKYEDSKALSEDKVAQIRSAITVFRINDIFLLKRDTLILSILIYTGVRKGELLGLRIQDIDWSNRQLYINGKTSKSKKSRSIPINPTLFMHLKTYMMELQNRKISSEYLLLSSTKFTKYTEHGLKYWVNKYKELSGVYFHLHQFRHTFACTLAKAHADITSIKCLMGHESTTMTERYLRSITTESARGFVDNLSY